MKILLCAVTVSVLAAVFCAMQKQTARKKENEVQQYDD